MRMIASEGGHIKSMPQAAEVSLGLAPIRFPCSALAREMAMAAKYIYRHRHKMLMILVWRGVPDEMQR